LAVLEGLERSGEIIIDDSWRTELVNAFMEAFKETSLINYVQVDTFNSELTQVRSSINKGDADTLQTAKAHTDSETIRSIDMSMNEENY
jgi:hypothetical protein